MNLNEAVDKSVVSVTVFVAGDEVSNQDLLNFLASPTNTGNLCVVTCNAM